MDNLERNCFYRIIYGGGIFVLFFSSQGLELCTEKLSRVGILMEKISGLGVRLGGDSNQSN